MSGISTLQRATNVNIPTTVETVALTIPFSGGMSYNPSLSMAAGVGSPPKLKISGNINMQGGTAATQVSIRCRRNSLTGAQVGDTLVVPNAAVPDGIAYEFQDPTPGFAQVYVITIQQTSATGNGTANAITGATQDYN